MPRPWCSVVRHYLSTRADRPRECVSSNRETQRSDDLGLELLHGFLAGRSTHGTRVLPAPSHQHHSRAASHRSRSEEHTSELQSQSNLVCRLLLEKKKT